MLSTTSRTTSQHPRIFPVLLASIALTLTGLQAHAQDVAVKTNFISDAAASPNIGIELGLAPKWSLDVSGQGNFWTIKGHKWKHWLVQPETRYWLCDRFAGHFFGVEAHGGQYNVGHFNLNLDMLGTDFRKLKDHRYQGWFVGGGITYGYAWILGKHWNLEAEIGLGYSYTKYDSFECKGCGKKVEAGKTHHYWGPTKAALNLVYIF